MSQPSNLSAETVLNDIKVFAKEHSTALIAGGVAAAVLAAFGGYKSHQSKKAKKIAEQTALFNAVDVAVTLAQKCFLVAPDAPFFAPFLKQKDALAKAAFEGTLTDEQIAFLKSFSAANM